MQFLDFNFVTAFYTKKIQDKQRIMSQATNKEGGFSSQQYSNYFSVWYPTDFIGLRLNALWLKIKT